MEVMSGYVATGLLWQVSDLAAFDTNGYHRFHIPHLVKVQEFLVYIGCLDPIHYLQLRCLLLINQTHLAVPPWRSMTLSHQLLQVLLPNYLAHTIVPISAFCKASQCLWPLLWGEWCKGWERERVIARHELWHLQFRRTSSEVSKVEIKLDSVVPLNNVTLSFVCQWKNNVPTGFGFASHLGRV